MSITLHDDNLTFTYAVGFPPTHQPLLVEYADGDGFRIFNSPIGRLANPPIVKLFDSLLYNYNPDNGSLYTYNAEYAAANGVSYDGPNVLEEPSFDTLVVY